MDDSDNEIFWGPVTKQELDVVKGTFFEVASERRRSVGECSDECKENENCSDQCTGYKSEQDDIETDREEFHPSQYQNDFCEIINEEISLASSGYLSSSASAHFKSDLDRCTERSKKLVDSSIQTCEVNNSDILADISMEILSVNSSKKSKTSLPKIIVTLPTKFSETYGYIQDSVDCHPIVENSELSEICMKETVSVSSAGDIDLVDNKVFENTESAANELLPHCNNTNTYSECDLKATENTNYLDSINEKNQSISDTNDDVSSKGHTSFSQSTLGTSINCLPCTSKEHTFSFSNSSKSSLGFKSEISSDDVICESDIARDQSISVIDGDVSNKENIPSHCNESRGSSTCNLSNGPNEMGLKKYHTSIISDSSKSSLSSNKSNINLSDIVSDGSALSHKHIENENYNEDHGCGGIIYSSRSCVSNSLESLHQNMTSSSIQPESLGDNVDACDILHCEKSKLSKKNSRYSAYEKEKFTWLKTNAFHGEMLDEEKEEISDSILGNSDSVSGSDSENKDDLLNDTIEEMEMMMKHGLQYMCSKNDSSFSPQVSDDNKQQEFIPPSVQPTTGKRIPFGSKLAHHFPISKIPSGSNLKKNISPRIGADHKIPCNMKAPRNGAPRDMKISSKKTNYFSNIKSPVANYINSRPVPLVAVKNINAKSNIRGDNNLQSHCNISPVQLTPFRSMPTHHTPGRIMAPLPVIKYETAPVVNIRPRSEERKTPAKVAAITPKVTKHTGRALLANAPSGAMLLMKQAEVSMVYDRDASQTSTL